MTEEKISSRARILPFVVVLVALLVWTALALFKLFPESVFPSPAAVARGFVEELRTGRLLDDVVASLFRVTTGFALAVFAGIPAGLWFGVIRFKPWRLGSRGARLWRNVTIPSGRELAA